MAGEIRPMMEDIYQKVIYTGKMGTALVPKVTRSGSANYLVLKFKKMSESQTKAGNQEKI